MKILEGPAPSGPRSRQSATLHQNHIFIKVPHDLFKFTTADENAGLGGSVGADLRAAISLTRGSPRRSAASTFKTAFLKKQAVTELKRNEKDLIILQVRYFS